MSGRAGRGWGRRHTVMLLCFLALFIAYTDRVNISVAAVAMREQLGWTQTTKGLVLSAFFIGYMLVHDCERLGSRAAMVASACWRRRS